jgi:hypothetical protein
LTEISTKGKTEERTGERKSQEQEKVDIVNKLCRKSFAENTCSDKHAQEVRAFTMLILGEKHSWQKEKQLQSLEA